MAEFIKTRYAPRSNGLASQIHHEWQDKAIRYADALKIDLQASFVKENGKRYPIASSWFKIFKESDDNKNGKAANIDRAYSFFYDDEKWQTFTDERKFKFFRAVYHNGVERFQNKYDFTQMDY